MAVSKAFYSTQDEFNEYSDDNGLFKESANFVTTRYESSKQVCAWFHQENTYPIFEVIYTLITKQYCRPYADLRTKVVLGSHLYEP